MTSDSAPELRPELLEDFYAECDEQLADIRADLARLDPPGAAPLSRDNAALASLFRNVHTLKGNAGIVRLRPMEELAHAMEDLLRLWSRRRAPPTSAELDLLYRAVQRLEELVHRHRARGDLPEVADLLRALAEVDRAGAAETSSVAPDLPATAPAVAARFAGARLWKCRFSPAVDLDQRGINVTSVRQRLGARGDIVHAAPAIAADGSISFLFDVAMNADPTSEELAAWITDGLHCEPVPPESLAAEPNPSATDTLPHHGVSSVAASAPSHVVRVDLAKLDELMRITGDLVITRSRLEDRLNQGADLAALKELSVGLGRSLRDLRAAVSRVRMVPIDEAFSRMPFALRDLLRDSPKRARLQIEGHQTEVDKYLVERLKEPLLHLVRNAFVHGVEPPEERRAAEKPAEATIVLSATGVGQSVEIAVRDDGRGVDVARVTQHARSLGLTVPEMPDAAAVLRLLCHPGFSTQSEADRAAGRGVGMAVVANTIRELGGTLAMETALGEGTTFLLRLPLTLSIVDALIVGIGDHVCGVPRDFVDQIVEVPRRELRAIRTTEVVPYRDALLPVTHLRSWFGMAPSTRSDLTVLVMKSERGAAGLAVDRAITQREVVVRPFHDPLVRVPGFSGATELGDGRPILMLDPVILTSGVVRPLVHGGMLSA